MMDKLTPPTRHPRRPFAGGHSENKPGLARGQRGWMALSWEHTPVTARPCASTRVHTDECSRMHPRSPCRLRRTRVRLRARMIVHARVHTHMVAQTRSCAGTGVHTHTQAFTHMDTHILTHTAQQPSTAPAPAVGSAGGVTGE